MVRCKEVSIRDEGEYTLELSFEFPEQKERNFTRMLWVSISYNNDRYTANFTFIGINDEWNRVSLEGLTIDELEFLSCVSNLVRGVLIDLTNAVPINRIIGYLLA